MPVVGNAYTVRPVKEIYIGIDPGASGGLAEIAIDCTEAIPMPRTEKDIWEWVHWFQAGQKPYAMIEKVSGYIGESQPGSRAFRFGQSYGSLRMALIAAGVPFEEVTPQTWQKALGVSPRRKGGKKCDMCSGLGTIGVRDSVDEQIDCPRCQNKPRLKEESKSQWKNRLKAKAQQLFPKLKITLKTADAILIAEYCRRKREGRL